MGVGTIHSRFVDFSRGVWKSNRRIQVGYCRQTLVPIGMVAEADVLYLGAVEYVVGYRLSGAGEKYGLPIAAYLLQQSKSLPHSLNRIFGNTSTTRDTRAVINRARILEALVAKKTEVRGTDIALELGLNRITVSNNLERLNRLGLVEYQAVDTEQVGWASYTHRKDASIDSVRTVGRWLKLTSYVARTILVLGTVNAQDLAKSLKDNYPQSSLKSLCQNISRVLVGLAKQGFCQADYFVGGEKQSKARILPEGRQIVQAIIMPIRAALADNRELVNSWRQINWQNDASAAIARHRDSSGKINQKPVEQRADEAFWVIVQNPGIRPREIEQIIGRKSADLLRLLFEQNKVRKVKEGRAVRYYPAEQS